MLGISSCWSGAKGGPICTSYRGLLLLCGSVSLQRRYLVVGPWLLLLGRLAVGRRSWTWSREEDAEQGSNRTNLEPVAMDVFKKKRHEIVF